MSFQTSIKELIRFKPAFFSGLFLLCVAVLCMAAPIIEMMMGVDSNRVSLMDRFAAPSLDAWLGYDELGRDVFIRLLYAGQISLTVSFFTAMFVACLGTIIGVTAGWLGGRWDGLIMRMTDGVIALPLLPLLIVMAALDYSKLGLSFIMESQQGSVFRIVLILSLFAWPLVARLTRAETLRVKNLDYVRAAHAMGVSSWGIVLRHIMPSLISVIVVATTLSIGNIILLESVLSFLGLGIDPPTPSWGNMLSNAQDLIWDNPVLMLYPGMMIFLTVMAFNFLGDGLQHIFNPKLKS